MNARELEVMRLEQDFKDTLENEIEKNSQKNVKVEIKDIKLVGDAVWKDKINGKDLNEKVFIVEKEITEIDENGKERKVKQENYYLGDKCIGGRYGDNIIYSENFKISEADKMKAVEELLSRTDEKDIEKNSLNYLEKKELSEVLSEHFGRKISEEEVEKALEELDKEELEEVKEDKEEKEEAKSKNKDEKDLSENKTKKIKKMSVQKADLNKKIDGKETLGERLDLREYESIYIIHSDKANKITADQKINDTEYSLVGITKKGEARILNDEFEIDKSVGIDANRMQTKIREDGTATRDRNDLSVYSRKTNGASIGCENKQGKVNMFFYQKTLGENENVGIQVDTPKTNKIPIETREVMNRNKGLNHVNKVRDEVKENIENDKEPKDVKDFDGEKETYTEISNENEMEEYVQEIMNYQNKNGEEKIREVFTESEVKDKISREVEKNKDKFSIEEIISNIKTEMNQDAENLTREHKK